MVGRGVEPAAIRKVLECPCDIIPTPQNSLRFEGTCEGGRTLKVWVVATDDGAGGRVPEHDGHGRLIVKSVAWRGESDA